MAPAFGRVLHDNDCEDLNLCGDIGKPVTPLILNLDDCNQTKLAYEWGDFYASNALRVGDMVRFRRDSHDTNHTYHVYKVLKVKT